LNREGAKDAKVVFLFLSSFPEEREKTQSACGVSFEEECHFLPFFRKGKK
jgi:hypothetical protein